MSTKQENTEFNKFVNELVINLGEVFVSFIRTMWRGIQASFNIEFFFLIGICASLLLIPFDWDYYLINSVYPDLFNPENEINVIGLNRMKVRAAIITIILPLYFLLRGIIQIMKFSRYQNALDSTGLKNPKDQAPRVVAVYNEGKYFKVVKVWAFGIGARKFKEKISLIESTFRQEIEEIRECSDRGYVEVVVNNTDLPESIDFDEVLPQTEKSSTCIIGESKNGLVTTKISTLPHLLIAGSTGGGKSKCFKGILYSALKTTPKLQMYLIDLKGGIEFKDFGTLPNVNVIKTVDDSVQLLKNVRAEMMKRFKYLEEKGLEKLSEKEPFDQIIVGIDEASVLYAKASKDHPNYQGVMKARELTEEITKLSRAARISMIFATQKVTKDTIDTRVQENVTGRVCFKLNTIEGSVRVLGNNKAVDLPYIPGRGIWQCGSEQVEIQVPYLSQEKLKEKLIILSEVMTLNNYKLNRPMLGMTKTEVQKKRSSFRDDLNKSNMEIEND